MGITRILTRIEISERLAVSVNHLNPPGIFSTVHGGGERWPRSRLELASIAIIFCLDGGMEFDVPNGPTSREISRKDTGDAVTIGLVLAAVVATFVLFGPILLKSDQKSMDVVATQPTDSPIKTP